ncbi:polar amino acid ABC transporter permease [Clostridium sartagoforme AAU1]|uniref:Polar amino acid ABC transporter permease n=1 Tax=Clostridium sartagoforme AAU1 TaxID=1202534 RepID=R9C1K8_9CLOT|nr:amino acid ABC transporter permease [Clostridium sartagoforme]EOR21111.1 polar amino acid ABC transporter permease [Clostridium sartagoforme AAU1]
MESLGNNIIFNFDNGKRLIEGLLVTLNIAVVSVVLSTILGIIFGIVMTSKKKIVKIICNIYLESIRIIPIMVWLFIFYFGVPTLLDVHLDSVIVGYIVFTLWGTAEIGDLVRGAITSIPKIYYESSMALSLNKAKTYRYIIIPISIRRVLPGIINLSTRMIKTTTLMTLIGTVDLVKVGQQIIERTVLTEPMASFWIYGLLLIIYFLICFPISLGAKALEKKLN